MNWLTALKILLQLAAFIARRAQQNEVERNLINELKILQGERIDRAADARDDVLSGRVQPDPHDKYRRD